MNRGVPDFGDRLDWRHVEDRKRSLADARRNQRRLLVNGGEPVKKALLECLPRFPVPAEEFTEQDAKREEKFRAGARSRDAVLGQKTSEVDDTPFRSGAREVDSPHVVQRNVG